MLGVRIALLRLQRGMSQGKLARKLNVSTSAIGMYEQGRRMPSLELVVRLAREFSVTTDYLLTGETPGKERLEGMQNVEIKTEKLLQMLRAMAGK